MALPTVFSPGDVFTAANANLLRSNSYNQTVSTKTANYVLVAGDVGTRIVMNSASATTITVNTSLFAAGDTLQISNIGAGVCTITPGTATVSTVSSLSVYQHGSGTLYFTSAGVSIFFPDSGAASATTAFTGGQQTSSSTSFAGLTTATAVTVTTGTSALVVAIARCMADTANVEAEVSYAVSGATTVAASDNYSGRFDQSNATAYTGASVPAFFVHTGLTAGSNTFTMQFKVNAGLGFFADRRITVFPL